MVKISFHSNACSCCGEGFGCSCTHPELVKLNKIQAIAEKWYAERYDTDWDSLQGFLSKIRRIVK